MYQLFDKWEFYSLIDRLGIDRSRKNTEQQVELAIDRLTLETEKKWEQILLDQGPYAIHIETIGEELHGHQIMGIAISNGTDTLFLTLEQFLQWIPLKNWLQDETKKKWVFDGKKMEMICFWNGLEMKGFHSDLLLGAYLLNPQDGTPSLTDVAKQYRYDGLQEDEVIFGKGAKYTLPDESAYMDHVCRKADAIYSLVPIIDEKLKETNLDSLLYEIELPLSRVLAKMEKKAFELIPIG